LDLSNESARRDLFAELGRRASRVLVVAEGLLIYLTAEEVAALARDLAAPATFQRWIMDLGSPALLRMLKKKMGGPLEQAGSPLKFAPEQGPEFFAPFGWKAEEMDSAIHTAGKLHRLPFFLRLMAKISSPHFQPTRPWSAVCLFAKRAGL
jgi:O-methyltransferase involved in polyketide biosynthesis